MSDSYPVDTNEMTVNLQIVDNASKTSHDRLLDSYWARSNFVLKIELYLNFSLN